MDNSRKRIKINWKKFLFYALGIISFAPFCFNLYSCATRTGAEWKARAHAERALTALSLKVASRELDSIRRLAKETGDEDVKEWYKQVRPYHKEMHFCLKNKCSADRTANALRDFKIAFRKGKNDLSPKGLRNKGKSNMLYLLISLGTLILILLGIISIIHAYDHC